MATFQVPRVAPAPPHAWGPPSLDTTTLDVLTAPVTTAAAAAAVEGEAKEATPASTTSTSSTSTPTIIPFSLDELQQPSLLNGGIRKFASLPYSPFGRSDRLGRVADFTGRNRMMGGGGGGNQGGGGGGNYQGGGNQGGYGGGGGGGYQGGNQGGGFNQGGGNQGGYRQQRQQGGNRYGGNQGGGDALDGGLDGAAADGGDSTAFQLVDTTKTVTTKRFVNPASKRRLHSQRLRQINARRQAAAGGSGALDKMTFTRGGHGGGGRGGRGGPGGRGGRGGPGGRGGRFGNYHNRLDRQPSVAVQSNWIKVDELDLPKITKQVAASTAVPTVQDVLWCGFLDPYNDVYDKVTARQPVPLKRMENKLFYPVTTTDDPVLEKLAIDGMGQVFITDAILSHLMTCTRSVYPWDIVVQKLPGGTLFFDKRDNSQFDYLTVNETAYNPPSDEEGINSPSRLSLESTMVCQNFSQQILKKSGRQPMALPNPFYDEEEDAAEDPEGNKMEPASVAYRYRKWTLENGTTVVARTELHGVVKKTQYMSAFCLNEYTPTAAVASTTGQNPTTPAPAASTAAAAGSSWREKMDSQRGAVLATELKNNAFKLAKWTAQSLLAGADQMKIGFATRTNPKQAHEHVLLATQFYRPRDFAQQITLHESQMWAVFGYFCQLFQKLPDESGKYVLMRDPNKPILHIYKVPPETFEDDDEGDGDDGDEDDGNQGGGRNDDEDDDA